jgi:GTP pyrophosphokinase
MDDLLTRLARCCKPIPGDSIVGFITQGRGVSIHRQHCANILHAQKQHDPRLIPVSWDAHTPGHYFADLILEATPRETLLKDIVALLANIKIPLLTLTSNATQRAATIFVYLTVKIEHANELQNVQKQLARLPGVFGVGRSRR